MKKRIILLVLICTILFTFCGCGNKSPAGEWVVSEYKLNGKSVSTSQIFDYLGSDTRMNEYVITFSSDGSYSVGSPTGITQGNYDFHDGTITLYDHNNAVFDTLEYSRNRIRVPITQGLVMIMKKK